MIKRVFLFIFGILLITFALIGPCLEKVQGKEVIVELFPTFSLYVSSLNILSLFCILLRQAKLLIFTFYSLLLLITNFLIEKSLEKIIFHNKIYIYFIVGLFCLLINTNYLVKYKKPPKPRRLWCQYTNSFSWELDIYQNLFFYSTLYKFFLFFVKKGPPRYRRCVCV